MRPVAAVTPSESESSEPLRSALSGIDRAIKELESARSEQKLVTQSFNEAIAMFRARLQMHPSGPGGANTSA